MAGEPTNLDLGDLEARHLVMPLTVASVSSPDPTGGSDHEPFALVLTVDVDRVPGLQGVIDRVAAGEVFDVISRWAAAISDDGKDTPYAVLDFYLPEFELGVQIAINVDQHPESLQAAVRTGRVMVISPAQNELLQHQEELGTWIVEARPFGMEPPDATPIVGLMHQRFELPRPIYQPERQVIDEPIEDEEVAAFLDGARPVTMAAVSIRGDSSVRIILVDPDSRPLKEQIPDGADILGRWGVMAGGDHVVVAFDAVAAGKPVGRWVLLDPSPELIRAGSHGEHGVGILTELSTGDQAETERQWAEGIHAWVKHVEAFRALRFREGGDSSN